MKIVNGTNHKICIYAEADCVPIENGRKLILNPGALPLAIIPPGTPLNAIKGHAPLPEGEYGFPVRGAVTFTGADPVPEGDLIIVSNPYRAACLELGRDTSRLGTPDGLVFKDKFSPSPCGCTAIAVG